MRFAQDLGPMLRRSAPARVRRVASLASLPAMIDFDHLQSAQSYDQYAVYARTKLANVLCARPLAQRQPTRWWDEPEVAAECVVSRTPEASPDGVAGTFLVDGKPRRTAPLATGSEFVERSWRAIDRLIHAAVSVPR